MSWLDAFAASILTVFAVNYFGLLRRMPPRVEWYYDLLGWLIILVIMGLCVYQLGKHW